MQVDASDKRQYEGTGIGLALVKEYATLHGGTVDVESVEGEGTTFTLTFVKGKDHLDPDSVIDADEEAVEAVSATNLADFDVDEGDEDAFDAEDDLMAADLGVSQDEMVREAERLLDESGADADINDDDARVLVVDDVPDMRRFIAHVLKERYTVKTAKDGVQGLEAAAKWRPDLIVSDVMMPRKTGYELCEELKKSSDESLARTPVILLSAKAEMSQKLEGLEYGADDYLTKPFNANELLVRARNLIRLRRQEKKLHDERVRAVEAERRALETEMSVARDIQQTILPTVTAFDEDGIALTGYLDSASACSGDFWTWEKLASGDYLVILGDVAGHGAGSAM
jgi:DNA-binding response OmpR family regulator